MSKCPKCGEVTPDEIYECSRDSILFSLAHYKRVVDGKDHVHDISDVIEWALSRADDDFEKLMGREFIPAMQRSKE